MLTYKKSGPSGIIAFILLLMLLSGASIGDNLYFICGEQGWHKNGKPFPIEILMYDYPDNHLVPKWKYQDNDDIISIDVFPNEDIAMVTTGNINISQILIFRSATITNPLHINLDNDATKINLVYDMSGRYSLYVNLINNGKAFLSKEFYNIRDGKPQSDKSISQYDRIITSNGPSMSGAGVLSASIIKGYFIIEEYDIMLPTAPMPPDLIRSDSSRGWILIASTKEYYAIIDLPVDEKAKYREVLLYDKVNSIWHSFMIDGVETRLRLIGNILVGYIAHADPATNYSKFIRYPSLITNDVAFLDPINKMYSIIELDERSEILWIWGSEVIYRKKDSLYKAQLVNNELIDEIVLLTDPKVIHIHWAFPVK